MAEVPSLRVARYTTMDTKLTPRGAEPLNATVQADFGASIETLGGAYKQLLAGSGYRLMFAAKAAGTPLTALPLPANQRDFGAMRLIDVLTLLAGPGNTVVIDRVHRLIALEPCPFGAMRPMVAP